ncbi:MAG: DOPA 4,5-dioxygenase family protein [Geminicoccaceae bacterium]
MPADPGVIRLFHAHVYYTEASRPRAADLRSALGARFAVTLGRWHDQPIGPHSRGMYQVAFPPEAFADLLPWLMLNRDGLDILVHPETGDEVADHTAHALWLGERLPLRLEALAPGVPT